jgi:transcription initiation factor IIE alpha subunit
MRLYIYLISISHFNGKDKPRVFSHRDFTINKIKEMLHMHPTTIKKYWALLEENGLIKYEGPRHYEENWGKEFMARKKDGTTYYTIKKGTPYRIMPKETLDKIQYEYLVSELELKLYLLLA